jgi:hypothetical protein
MTGCVQCSLGSVPVTSNCTASRPALELTQPPVQWEPGLSLKGQNGWGHECDPLPPPYFHVFSALFRYLGSWQRYTANIGMAAMLISETYAC